jgi:hypothetical protein
MAVIPLITQPAGYLFDRARSAHPWLAALDALQAGSAPGHAVLAQNWRMDGRVDLAREAHFDSAGCFPGDGSVGGFDIAIEKYYQDYLCRSPLAAPRAAYAESANQSNLIPFDERPHPNHRLLHLASVRRLLKYVSGKTDFELAVFKLAGVRLSTYSGNAEIEKLVHALQMRGLETVKKFARLLSDTLGDTEPHWWAAFSHEIGDLGATSDWTDAVRKTGLGHIVQGDWLLAWHYSPEMAGRLYRPTVAEAGKSPFHFPSPPGSSYGIAMPLVSGLRPVRELIHAPLKGDISAAGCIGFGQVLGDPADMQGQHETASWFQARRREHGWELVANQPPHAPAHAWLLRHAILP